MANIQLIATDLDGTFLADDKTFDHTLFRTVLTQLKAQHIAFAIATGVHQTRINRIMAGFLNDGINFVSNNGARVVTGDGQVLYERAIPRATLAQITTLIANFEPKPDQGVVYSTDDTAYIPRAFANVVMDKHLKYFQHIVIFDDVADIAEPIFKVTMNWRDFDELQFYTAAKQALGHAVHVTETGTGAIDIVPAGVNKAVGLQVLADRLGIEMAHVAAFGDGGNDVEMLTHVGYPFIMPKTTLVGDFLPVVADNNHDGVSRTILQLLAKNDASY
ncbi:HAD-IIB family hydrolase [Leuconostoc lactis]